jgi:hypothetical protein
MRYHLFRYGGGEEPEDDLILHLPVKIGWIRRSGGDVLLYSGDGGRWAWNRSINIPKEITPFEMWNDLGQPCRVIFLSEFNELEVGKGNKLRNDGFGCH